MIGTELGRYRVLEKLGEGGMGEVYAARDNSLNRDVAIKVLPALFASDPERLARFSREAHTLAQLNHPHIAHVYGFEDAGGVKALVMELVDGRTLAEMMAQPAGIPMADALDIARQIADALEAAHELGIVHRDLKPANVKVRPDGTVKVLDFGLAKAMSADSGLTAGAALQDLATVTSPAVTQVGVILGTAAYMAPEQARGKAVDRRADIWAFGCLLFEMLTGRRPFEGETVTDVLSAIVSREPDWNAPPPSTPAPVVHLLRRCLQKDPRKRLRDIGEARLTLEMPETPPPAATHPVASAGHWPVGWTASAVLSAVTIVTLSWAYMSWRGQSAPSTSAAVVTRFGIEAPDPTASLTLVFRPSVAVSANGHAIAFVAETGGLERVYVRRRADAAVSVAPGSDHGTSPALSPDGNSIAFFSSGQIRTAPLGGEPTAIAPAPDARGISWTDDGMLVFAADSVTGLTMMSAAGGKSRHLTARLPGERTHRWPQALPGGKAVLFTVGTADSPDRYDAANIDAVITATGERRVVLAGSAMARYCGDGHLLFTKGAALYSIGFDPERLKTSGEPVQVAPAVARDASTGAAHFDCAADGTLAYVPATSLSELRQLFWVKEDGRMEPLKLPPGAYQEAQVSPDGKHAVLLNGSSLNGDVWLLDLSTGTFRRLTFNSTNTAPIWSADGAAVYYTSFDLSKNISMLLKKPVDGSRDAVTLGTHIGRAYVDWVAADETAAILDTVDTATERGDVVRLTFGPTPSSQVLTASPRNDFAGALSPNGRWLAYQSDDTGRQEVFVLEPGGSGGRWQVTTDGGQEPRWSADGRQLFYRSSNRLMAVPLNGGNTFAYGRPKPLFDGIYNSGIESGRSYDVDPTGGRFLLVRPADTGPAPRAVRVTLNWPVELTKKR